MVVNNEILTEFTNDKIINFRASRYRLKVIINNLDSPFVILFQGFCSSLTQKNNMNELWNIPNYMEKTFKNNTNYNYIYVTIFI